jgi:hypothetical protein
VVLEPIATLREEGVMGWQRPTPLAIETRRLARERVYEHIREGTLKLGSGSDAIDRAIGLMIHKRPDLIAQAARNLRLGRDFTTKHRRKQ